MFKSVHLLKNKSSQSIFSKKIQVGASWLKKIRNGAFFKRIQLCHQWTEHCRGQSHDQIGIYVAYIQLSGTLRFCHMSRSLSVSSLVHQDTWFLGLIYFFDQMFFSVYGGGSWFDFFCLGLLTWTALRNAVPRDITVTVPWPMDWVQFATETYQARYLILGADKIGDSPIKHDLRLGPQTHFVAKSQSERTIQLVPKPRKMAIIIPQRQRETWEGVPVATWCIEWMCRMRGGLGPHILNIPISLSLPPMWSAAIDWFWLRGWLINKGAICTRTAPLFWIFISLFQNPRTRLVRKISSPNQSIGRAPTILQNDLFYTRICNFVQSLAATIWGCGLTLEEQWWRS